MLKKIILISDTHFSKDNTLLFDKYDSEYSFNLLVKKIIIEQPDMIFVLGDISQDGSIESYIKAQQIFNQFNCQKIVIMGNHDSNYIKTIVDNQNTFLDYIDFNDHRFIFLSSIKGDNYNEGFIYEKEINKIKTFFNKEKQNYIILHHHFIKSDSIMDTAIIENHEFFSTFLLNYDITAIFHGHVHNIYSSLLGGINIYANPSTCVQFSKEKTLKTEPIIGYRVIKLFKGKYETKTFTQIIN